MPNTPPSEVVKALLEMDRLTEGQRKDDAQRTENIAFSPLEAQVAFIKELVKQPNEAKLFQNDPKQYSVEHGILLSPSVVEKVCSQALYDVAMDADFCTSVGPHITKDLLDIRARLQRGRLPTAPISGPGSLDPGTTANVLAVAACVAAAAAVVEAVVTVVRTTKPSDLLTLQGLGDKGTLLPGGTRFKDRTGIRDISTLPGLRSGGLTRLR